MAGKRKINNLLALAVLSYLVKRPQHPYELGRVLREHGDDRSIKFTHGSLYMVIRQLTQAGFVTEVETTRSGARPERTIYALTDAGRTELHDWLRDLIAQPEHEYPRFITALSLIGALPPDEAVACLTDRLTRLAAGRADIQGQLDQARAADIHPLFLIEEEYRLALLDTEMSFIEEFIARITDPVTGWRPAWARFHDSLRS